MNFRRIYITLLALIVVGVGCSDGFLEINPQQSVSNEEALLTLQDYEAAITGAYNILSSSNYYGRYFVLVPDVMADDVKQNSQANRAKEYAEYVAFEEHFITEGMWATIYSGISAVNAIINAPKPDIAASLDDEYNQLIGEAHALRGQMYFDLVRLYGQHYTYTTDASHLGVPIVLETDEESEPVRNTVAEVYNQVISDLTTSIGLMQPTTRNGNTATLSSWAAKALLARVYLYQEDWANAEAMADDVIENGPYQLVSNANYVASWSDDFDAESIFEISMTESDNRGSDALGRMYIESGYGDYLPSDDLYSLIPAGDVRQQLFIVDGNLSGDYAPFRLNKYPSTTGLDNTIVIRLSELYLIRAEAAAMQADTNPSKNAIAQSDVTTIRQRGEPGQAPVVATGQALRDEIALERRIELAYEGQRLWDLMRKKQDMVRTQCTSTIPAACSVSYPNDRFVLPIPANEQDANPNIQPNPGY
ncbi:RagB/SusD family nutrient uptake outer membrane protein [Balneola vulgaris]|uniref:RagB/SusD family nutrient uptake outer membrane protein n=1 Tax=Balneola vulgaris TaxID=287535 RepID=UPI0003800C54|nr:RagB/SusD family nutrient uptake outer membrane protein [Balneola vulgaris]